MKFFVVFAILVVAATAADYSSWTLTELCDAIQDPTTDPGDLLDLERAFNKRMDFMFNEPDEDTVDVPTTPLEISYWTLQELSDALQNPVTDPDLKPYLENALNKIMDVIFSGTQVEVAIVIAPVGLAPANPQSVENNVIPTRIMIRATKVAGRTTTIKPTASTTLRPKDEVDSEEALC